MDKLKSVLSGTDGPNENGNILQAANEASTLGWGTRVKGFIICFVIGVTCSILVSGFEHVAFLYTIIYSVTMCACAYLRTTHF
ncbi:unnamed protein product [Oncorhynchus mykiss]|uniref:Uncharacterized protein n=1 Tax=Oncorhynchus mykiss TaxID=8022 RepID=A0A061AED2_ONCMY|nr:unnamed protein product [Oncorhynchus mykiss]